METKTSIKIIKPGHIVCIAIFFISLITLFFTNRWEAQFAELNIHNVVWNGWNLTISKIVLAFLNASLAYIRLEPLQSEDERVDKIRNYVSRHVLGFGIGLGIIGGIFMKANFSVLIYTAILQGYYILLFQLCLYRDSAIIYMTKEEVKAYNLIVEKKFKSYTSIACVLIGIFTYGVLTYKRSDLLIYASLIPIGGVFLMKTIYITWKS